MLNFFRDLGETAAIVLAVLVTASVLVQNFWCRYVPIRGLARDGFPAEPFADPPLRICLHRLCEVRKGLPIGASGRPTDQHQIGRMHGMSGVCCRLSIGRCAATRVAALDARSKGRPIAGLGDGGGNCSVVLGNCWIRAFCRLLERRRSRLRVSPTRPPGEYGGSSC